MNQKPVRSVRAFSICPMITNSENRRGGIETHDRFPLGSQILFTSQLLHFSLQLSDLDLDFVRSQDEPFFEQGNMVRKLIGDAHHLRHILYSEKDDRRKSAVVLKIYLSGVEEHHLAADPREVVGDFKAPKERILREDLLEELSERRYVPLSVSELVHDFLFRIFRLHLERLIEWMISRDDPELFVQDQYRLVYDIHDSLDVCPAIFSDAFE